MRLRALVLASFVVLAVSSARPPTAFGSDPVEVTCRLFSDGNGAVHYFLADDLDCTGIQAAIQFSPGSRLDLRGHTLTGMVLWARGNVRFDGPGTITGSPADGIRHSTGVLTVRNAVITGNPRFGIVSLAGKVKLQNVTVSGNGIDGVAAYRSVQARDSIVTGNARFGISSRPDGTNVEGGAPCTETAKASIKLHATAVTGNGTGTECGTTAACADLATCGRSPQIVKASSCDTSYVLESGIPGDTLGVCTAD
jgi:hypothetical protein